MLASRLLAVVMGMFVVAVAAQKDSWCQQVDVAVSKNSIWTFNPDIKTLKWQERTSAAQPIPQCQQCQIGGGLGDVTRIQSTDNSNSAQMTSNNVCSGCLGNEVLTTDIKFCADPKANGVNDNNFRCTDAFGPCAEIKVYRCGCPTQSLPLPTTAPPPIVGQTQPPTQTTTQFWR